MEHLENSSLSNYMNRRAALMAGGVLALGVLAGCAEGGRQDGDRTSSSSSPELPSPPAEPLGELLFFASNRTGNYQLYKKNLQTGELVQLTDGAADHMNPQLSPDGNQLVFFSDREDGINQIYGLEIATPEDVRRLTDDGASDYDPAYMSDGSIVYKSNKDDGYGDIWRMNADGSERRNLTPPLRNTEEWKPCPLDDRHIVFTSRQADGGAETDELYLLDVETGVTTRLTDNNVPDWFPSPYPGKPNTFVFISKDNPKSPDALYMYDLASRKRTKVSPANLSGDLDDPSMSPDGKKITFIQSSLGRYAAILMMDLDGSNLRLLDEAPKGNNLSPILA